MIGERTDLDGAIERSRDRLLALQHSDGYWWAELESNVTITAEVVLLHHVWGTTHTRPLDKVVPYLRNEQCASGGWELFYDDGGELSTTIEAYMALRLLGVPAYDPALVRAKKFVLERGGISKSRIFTKMHLALAGAFPWKGLPAIPPWIMLLPPWGPFTIYDMSSWARGSTVPLAIVFDRQPVYGPPLDLGELYVEGYANARLDFPARDDVERFWNNVDRGLRLMHDCKLVPFRKAGLRAAARWVLERQETTGDWGGIIPAMLNSMLALRALGYAPDDPAVVRGFEAIDGFAIEEERAYRIQPCISPVWDTALCMRALVEAGVPRDDAAILRGTDWLIEKQIFQTGDWAVKNRRGKPGGWAFEFVNNWYPDVDDSAVVVMALHEADASDNSRRHLAIERGAHWIDSMQCKPGGWGAFDVDNDAYWLNRLPYADLRAMCDPNTADVTARVIEMHARCASARDVRGLERGRAYLLAEQEADGSWFGRWGVNYIYGTSGAMVALGFTHERPEHRAALERGADWFISVQQPDGGWGETCRTYDDPSLKGAGPSSASQTAWALIGLLAAPQLLDARGVAAVERGVAWLLERQRADGSWEEREFTGTGFPGHFYLRYHLYCEHFPLTALARYRAWRRGA